jgi:phage/plasmid-associated DNA primase
MRQVTGGNRQKYFRLQELFGLVISEIREVKVIPFLLGPKDSGKSIILKILEHLVGQEFFTNLSFEELNQPSFLCQLFGKKLNACGEVSEIALNRLDVFKKLSGGDYVMARYLYGQAFKFTCDEIEEIACRYTERNNSVKSFVDTCCILDPDLRTHNETLESAIAICRDNDLIEESNKVFHRTMQSLDGLKHTRFRLNDMNKNGYIGIGLVTTRLEGEKHAAD